MAAMASGYPHPVEPTATGGQMPWMRGWASPPAGAPVPPTRHSVVPATAVRVGGGGSGSPMPPPPGVAVSGATVVPASAEAIFNQIDRNHDGVITREEWNRAVAMTQPAVSVAAPARLRQPSPTPGVSIAVPTAAVTTVRVPSTTYLGASSSAAYLQSSARQQSPGRPVVTTTTASPNVPVWQVAVPVQTVQQTTTVRPAEVLPRPQNSLAVTPATRVTVPQGLLSRIDGVVSEMERELSEDLMMCVSAPLRDGARRKNNGEVGAIRSSATACTAAAGDSESTIDWLDKQIWAIEQRREACEMRQAHLGELRRIVAEGQTWHISDKVNGISEGSGAYTAESGGSRNLSTVLGGSEEDENGAGDDEEAEEELARQREAANAAATARRMTLLENENDLLRKKVEDLEVARMQQAQALSSSSREREDWLRMREQLEAECENRLTELRTIAEAVESGERRAEIAEQAANERVVQATLEAQALQSQLVEVEAAVSREREVSAQAVEAQTGAEADLRTLEENSRAVLNDCRALQAKVRELEAERATFSDVQVSFEEERRALNHRVRMLEDQRCELETNRQELADENLNLSRQHMQQLHTRDEQAIHELTTVRGRERLLHDELADKHAALLAAEARQRELTDVRSETLSAHNSARNADRARVAELERELADARNAAVALEASIQRFGGDRARIVEMEQELAEALGTQESQGRQLAQQRARVLELEQALADAHLTAEGHARQHGSFKASITSLEQQLGEAHEIRESHAQQHQTHRQRIAELEQQLVDSQTSGEHHMRQHNLLQGKFAELERHLEGALAAKEQHSKNHTSTHIRVTELEAQLQEAISAKDSHHRTYTSLKSRNAGLEEQIAEFLAVQAAHTKTHGELKRTVAQLEDQLADALAHQEKLTKQHNSSKLRCAELERTVEEHHTEALTLKDKVADHLSLKVEHQRARSRLSDIERELEEALRAKQRLEGLHTEKTKHHAALNDRVAELEDQLAAALREKEKHAMSTSTSMTRLQQIEAQLAQALEEKDRHVDRHQTSEVQIKRLQGLLEQALEEKESRSTKVAEFEAELVAALDEKAHYQQRHAEMEGRVANFEMQLANAEDLNTRSQGESRDRVLVLERQLQEAVIARDEFERGHVDFRARLLEMEAQLAEVIDARDHHREMHTRLQRSVPELEGKLAEAEALHEHQIAEHLRRINELESLLQGSQLSEERLDEDCQNLRVASSRQIQMLEEQLSEEQQAHRTTKQQHASTTEREKQVRDLQYQVATLQAELKEAREAFDVSRAELEKARIFGETVEQDAELALSKADEVRRRHETEWKERLDQASEVERSLRAQIRELEAQVRASHDAQDRRIESSNSITHMTSMVSEHRELHAVRSIRSNAAEALRTINSGRPALDTSKLVHDLILPGSTDSFVLRVQDAQRNAQDVLRSVGDSHHDMIEAQLLAVVAKSSTQGIRDVIDDYDRKQEIELDRRLQVNKIESVIHDLRSLREEAPTQHHLSQQDLEAILERIEIELQKCQDEQALLRSTSALGDLPDTFVQTLADIHRGASVQREWKEGFSPMHWCAQNGRRDIIDYLLRREDGKHMVHHRDKHGRTPLYYAESTRKRAVSDFLRHEAGGGEVAPLQLVDRRPSGADWKIPESYMTVLEQIETQGWHTVNWKSGYTMLHWAASKGHNDFCAYLVKLDADPNAADDEGKTPLSCALEADHGDCARLIGELCSRPRMGNELPALQQGDRAAGGAARAMTAVRSHPLPIKETLGSDGSESVWSEMSSRRKHIPDAYVKVMEQIDRIGWDKMQWARGFTLLHWAAKHDAADLVARFMAQGADPHHKDDTGKDAFDYAREKGSRNAEMQLRMPPPETVPPLSAHLSAQAQAQGMAKRHSLIDSRMSVGASVSPSLMFQQMALTTE